MTAEVRRLQEAERERDEARAEVARLRALWEAERAYRIALDAQRLAYITWILVSRAADASAMDLRTAWDRHEEAMKARARAVEDLRAAGGDP